MKDESSIKMKNKLKAYDQKTNKFLYEAHRDIILTVNKSKKTLFCMNPNHILMTRLSHVNLELLRK